MSGTVGGAEVEAEVSQARRVELTERLAAVRDRIAAACVAAGRDPGEVALMAVTKTVPAADVAALLDLGLTARGEPGAGGRGARSPRSPRSARTPGPGGTSSAGCSGTRPAPSCAGPIGWNRWTRSGSPTLSTPPSGALSTPAGAQASLSVLLQFSVDGDPQRGGVPREGLASSPNTSPAAPGCTSPG